MTYVTWGTVQITASVESDFKIKINPHQDYSVKHNKENYIIFMPNGNSISDAKVFKTKEVETLVIKKAKPLIHALIQAVANNTNIEIVVKIDNSNKITIESITIPAIF